jgi:hypothetical protein
MSLSPAAPVPRGETELAIPAMCNRIRGLKEWSVDALENASSSVASSRCRFAPQDRTWMWAIGHKGHIRRAAHGYEPTREAAMAAFAKTWRRE